MPCGALLFAHGPRVDSGVGCVFPRTLLPLGLCIPTRPFHGRGHSDVFAPLGLWATCSITPRDIPIPTRLVPSGGTRVYPLLGDFGSPVPYPHGASPSPHGCSMVGGSRVYPPPGDCGSPLPYLHRASLPPTIFPWLRELGRVRHSGMVSSPCHNPIGRPYPHTALPWPGELGCIPCSGVVPPRAIPIPTRPLHGRGQ